MTLFTINKQYAINIDKKSDTGYLEKYYKKQLELQNNFKIFIDQIINPYQKYNIRDNEEYNNNINLILNIIGIDNKIFNKLNGKHKLFLINILREINIDTAIILKKVSSLNLSIEKKIILILQNLFIKEEDKLDLDLFDFNKNYDLSEIINLKDSLENNRYISENTIKTVGPFSLINQEIKSYNSKDYPGNHYLDNYRIFYQICSKEQLPNNNSEYRAKKNDVLSNKQQLLINRLFSPLFQMTRLIEVNNTKNDNGIVSVDVIRSIKGIQVSDFSDNTDKYTKKFFRMLYQYIVKDYDRNIDEGINISNKGIIFDFDLAMGKNRFFQYKGEFYDTFSKEYNNKDFDNYLINIKKYLYNEIQELRKNFKTKEENITLDFIEYGLHSLNINNLKSFHNIVD